MAIVDLDAASAALSALGAAVLVVGAAFVSLSCFTSAGFEGSSVDVDLCGIFRISLYFGCLSHLSAIVNPGSE